MAKFPKDMLTPEVRLNISNAIEHMEASHTESAKAMWCMKKLVMTIPVSAFHLMLQVMVQHYINDFTASDQVKKKSTTQLHW